MICSSRETRQVCTPVEQDGAAYCGRGSTGSTGRHILAVPDLQRTRPLRDRLLRQRRRGGVLPQRPALPSGSRDSSEMSEADGSEQATREPALALAESQQPLASVISRCIILRRTEFRCRPEGIVMEIKNFRPRRSGKSASPVPDQGPPAQEYTFHLTCAQLNEAGRGPSGPILQHVQFNYSQARSILHEVGSTRVYYIGGPAKGRLDAVRMCGPTSSFDLSRAATGARSDFTVRPVSNVPRSGQLQMSKACVTNVGGAVVSGDVFIAEPMTFQYDDLRQLRP